MSKRSKKIQEPPKEDIRWEGKHTFYISGTDHEDDTIRVPSSYRKDEVLHKLILPTLCITYADMKFANDIGGVQADYPDSMVYGERYFDPPIALNGEEEIEKFTWIRGAEKVTIGPKETIIEWWGWKDLVIPKLRIRPKEKVKSLMSISDVIITPSQPFRLSVQQYADGRHVGGIQVNKRHPSWEPKEEPDNYDLFIRVIDGKTRRAIPEAKVILRTWDEDKEGFVKEAEFWTNGMGIVDVKDLPCSNKKLIIVEHSQYMAQTWRFRPLPGQKVRRVFRLWKSKERKIPYVWRLQDSLKTISDLSKSRKTEILRMNRLKSERELRPGREIQITGYEAVYHVNPRDTLERLAEYFCYDSVEELAEANELAKPYKLYEDQELKLPGWVFFKAKDILLFEKIDEQFRVPIGWTRPAHRVLHDDPTRAYKDELIAVPTSEFAQEHRVNRRY